MDPSLAVAVASLVMALAVSAFALWAAMLILRRLSEVGTSLTVDLIHRHHHQLPWPMADVMESILHKELRALDETDALSFRVIPGPNGELGWIRLRPGQVLSYAGTPGEGATLLELHSGRQFIVAHPVDEVRRLLEGEENGEHPVADPGEQGAPREEALGRSHTRARSR